MKIVAILDRSDGNESVGEMWKETAIFPAETPVLDVLKWATSRRSGSSWPVERFIGNLIITIAQEAADE